MRKLCVGLALLCLAHNSGAERAWIDTDLSIGSPIREVDDAYALVLALHSPEIQIAGLSTTYGNASLSQTTRATLDLVERFGDSAGLGPGNVFDGAKSARTLGERTRASDALAASLRRRKLTYIALGPLTNLATFLRLHPALADRIERVIFLGGQAPGISLAFGPSRSFRIHDANVFKDPAAVKMVLDSKIPIVLVPIETASRLEIDRGDLRALKNSGPAGAYLAERSGVWLWFWTNFVKTKGGPIFDAVAIVPATRPELLSLKKRYARMDDAGNLLVTPGRTEGARPIRYCTGVAPGMKRFVLERLVTRRSRE
ncbi:MAG TPA: nucleoside hydrolase [Chthoniobacterales bacterium]|nr:nucleoside hydrolase [Chthoniobacterales bacterium]